MKAFADELRGLIAKGKTATEAMKLAWQGVRAGRVARPNRKKKRAASVTSRDPRMSQARKKIAQAAQRIKSKRRAKVKRNPDNNVQREIQQAIDRYTGFKGEKPQHLDQVQLPAQPRVLLTMGECVGIMYRTRRDGKVDQYLHRFRKGSRPTLAVSSDGKNLYLLGGAYRVTNRGIEDA